MYLYMLSMASCDEELLCHSLGRSLCNDADNDDDDNADGTMGGYPSWLVCMDDYYYAVMLANVKIIRTRTSIDTHISSTI